MLLFHFCDLVNIACLNLCNLKLLKSGSVCMCLTVVRRQSGVKKDLSVSVNDADRM